MSEHDETLAADSPARGASHGGLAPGTLFAGRYEVQAPLGSGGMGAVFRVRDRILDEVVALKLLTIASPQAVERFRREVRLARRVTHANVARTHDLGEHEGRCFLTMEYVPGGTLERLLSAEGRLEPARAAAVAEQIASGLEAAHAAGVIHRDLKPANVLLGGDGRVVITDFGIARALASDERTRETGGIVGTPHYMAPEQVLGVAVDARADLYALGVMLYELTTGRPPFEGDNPLAVAVMRVHETPADPRAVAPLPDALAALILRCLERDPAARAQSASEVRASLAALAGSPGSSPPGALARASTVLYAPLADGPGALAVLPFVVRGEGEHDYLGEGLAEELVDVLTATKGLRVLSLGATRRFAEARDPKVMGAVLGADTVVDGTIRLSGARVRIAARLVDTESGLQRWSGRFEGGLEDLFALQERMARRIAEALRLEIGAAAHRRSAPPEAIELYLRARAELRGDLLSFGGRSVELLERCLELAPGMTPAHPALAIAAIRAWWRHRDDEHESAVRARASVERALELAPELAETHLARAMLAVQDGQFQEAAQALARALEIAPTMPEANYYLAELQVEAGRLEEGSRRAELTLELDPTLAATYGPLARAAALGGDYDRAREHLDAMSAVLGRATYGAEMPRIRYALWRGANEEAIALSSQVGRIGGQEGPLLLALAEILTGDRSPIAGLALVRELVAWVDNPRAGSLIQQIGVELLCATDALAEAAELLHEAAEGLLIDIGWLRGCPLVGRLHGRQEHTAALALVERRAAAIWER